MWPYFYSAVDFQYFSLYKKKGLRNLIVDQVSVQGMPNTTRSVSEYLLYVSTDNKTFTEVLEAEDGRRVSSTYLGIYEVRLK